MKRYYVNKNSQLNGDHEVHVPGCSWFPDEGNRIYPGEFANCNDAITAAKKYYGQVNGCAYCVPSCHTS